MWASGLMSAFNPVAAGGDEPSFTEMIETWIEMAWQDGSFGWIGIANLPSSFAAAGVSARRGLRRGVHRPRQPRHHGRPVRPQRPGRRRRRRLPADRGVELRLGHRALRVHRGRIHPDGRRRDALDQRGHPRAAGGAGARATRSTSPTAGTCRGSREPAPTTTTSPTSSCREYRTFRLFTREPLRGTRPRAGWA